MNIEAKGIEPDDVDAIFRVYHTIKGVAGFLELDTVAALAHTTENLLNKARKGEATLEGAILDLVFDATEAMRNLMQDVKDAVETSRGFGARPEIPELIDRLADSGFDDDAIRGFLGENFQRVANAAWQSNPG